MLLLSLSSSDYPVTPGDSYQVSYLAADALMSFTTSVESDFTVNLGFFGKIRAEGLRFLDLKTEVELRVKRAYPQSQPTVTVVSNGLFRVHVDGEVTEAGYSTVWGLTRVSEVVGIYLTPYASIRNVEVVSAGGANRQYDLFRALRFGEKDQDPYLRPGDSVALGKCNRSIHLIGQIRREGVYQLLPGEGLRHLIEYYGDGFTIVADPSHVRLDRLATHGDSIAVSMVMDLRHGYDPGFQLRDMDTIVVPKKTDLLPVAVLEGAIVPDSLPQAGSTVSSNNGNGEPVRYSKFSVPFMEGETLYRVMWNRREQLYPDADLAHAYLVRRVGNTVIPVDLEALLYAYSPQQDLRLEPYDQLIIPFRQFVVSVTGGVKRPGQFAYVPNKTFRYYIDMAGGIDQELGTVSRAKVFDRNGGRLPRDSFLEPEARVHVPYSFSYYFFRYFPVITSATAAVFSAAYYFHQITQ